jgi:hypothetical protein
MYSRIPGYVIPCVRLLGRHTSLIQDRALPGLEPANVLPAHCRLLCHKVYIECY